MHTNDRVLGGRLPLLDPKQLEGDQETLYKLLNSTSLHGQRRVASKAELMTENSSALSIPTSTALESLRVGYISCRRSREQPA